MTPATIAAIRKKAGFSQSKLAAMLGLSDSRTVRHWENGTREISGPASILMEMLDRGEIPARYLIGGGEV